MTSHQRLNYQIVIDVRSIPVIESRCDASKGGERRDLRSVSYIEPGLVDLLLGWSVEKT
jgi:hypothetical protein